MWACEFLLVFECSKQFRRVSLKCFVIHWDISISARCRIHRQIILGSRRKSTAAGARVVAPQVGLPRASRPATYFDPAYDANEPATDAGLLSWIIRDTAAACRLLCAATSSNWDVAVGSRKVALSDDAGWRGRLGMLGFCKDGPPQTGKAGSIRRLRPGRADSCIVAHCSRTPTRRVGQQWHRFARAQSCGTNARFGRQISRAGLGNLLQEDGLRGAFGRRAYYEFLPDHCPR